MSPNAILGLLFILLALGGQIFLVLWSRHRIERIHRAGPASARQILNRFNGESQGD